MLDQIPLMYCTCVLAQLFVLTKSPRCNAYNRRAGHRDAGPWNKERCVAKNIGNGPRRHPPAANDAPPLGPRRKGAETAAAPRHPAAGSLGWRG